MPYRYDEGVGWIWVTSDSESLLTPSIYVGPEPVDKIVANIPPLPTLDQPSSNAFLPQEYDLLRSNEELAPNFKYDRGLGQSGSNVDYTSPSPQPNFGGGEVRGSAGVGGQGAITASAPVGPNFGGGEVRGFGGIGGDRAIGPDGQIGPDFTPVGVGPTDTTTTTAVDIPLDNIEVTARAGAGPDWRFKIGLLPGSEVLYADGNTDSILAPLMATDGVIFPYTPNIIINYTANYNKIAPVHTNYPTYFYENSEISDVQINATFTAQSTEEADYMMAVIHFFRSATKMFYGQDTNRGTPPPLIECSGFGSNQFNFNKAVIRQFNYALPDNVDYVRTSGFDPMSINPLTQRGILSGGQGKFGLFNIASRIGRLVGLGGNLVDGRTITQGAENNYFSANSNTKLEGEYGDSSYVPTKLEISLVLLPVVTRAEQTNKFSLKEYASGYPGGQW